jgi:hypothetical protein
MKKHASGSLMVGVFLMIALLVSSAVPSHAGSRWGSEGGGKWSGGGQGGSWHGGGMSHGSWHGGGWHGRHHSWGPRVFFGVGVAAPLWWYPYGYAYPYPYAYPAYSPPVVVESSPQTYIQQDTQAQQYWYYCQSPQGYYPYVKECPGGWQQVAPQPPQPPR